MRLLGSADWHLGLQRYGTPGADGVGSRIRDFEGTLQRFVETAVREMVPLVVFAGDTFNTRREGPHERAAVAAAVAQLRETGITVVIVPGNHDGRATVGDEDSDALRWLRELEMERVHVFLSQQAGLIETDDGPVAIAAYPYPHRRALDAELADAAPSDRVVLAGGRAERDIATLFESIDAPDDVPRLFVGHLTVADAVAGSETAMKMGWDVAIHRKTLAPFDFALLGHIHRLQQVGPKAWYAGSPEYIDFTEAGLQKGFLLVDFDRGTEPEVTVIPTGARPMLDIDVLMDEATDGWAEEITPPEPWKRGPIVRARVRSATRPDPARIAALQRTLIDRGASFVKTEVQLPESAPVDRRAAEPDPELDIMEATRRHLTAAGFPKVDAAMEAARRLVAAI